MTHTAGNCAPVAAIEPGSNAIQDTPARSDRERMLAAVEDGPSGLEGAVEILAAIAGVLDDAAFREECLTEDPEGNLRVEWENVMVYARSHRDDSTRARGLLLACLEAHNARYPPAARS